MKLANLNALIAAVESGSLRAAARRIGTSQPAVTKLLRELERELQTSLLVRSTQGVVPTAQGKVLYERALAAQRELGHAREQIVQLNGDMVGEISIGSVPFAIMQLIPHAVRSFSREFPEIQLRIREELYIEALTSLRRGDIDIALGPVPQGLPPGEFALEPLNPVAMVVVVRRASPLAQVTDLTQLAGERWIYTSASAGATGYARRLFDAHGLALPRAAAVVNSTLGLMGMLQSGDFLGLMPRSLAEHPAFAPFMAIVPVPTGVLDMAMGALVKPETMLKPAVRHLLAHLHRAAV